MKKLLCFLLASLAYVSWAYPAELKIMGGVSLSRSTEPLRGAIFELDYEPVYGAGAILGGGLEFNLKQKIAFEIDALYFQKGSRIRVSWESDDVVVDRFMERMDELSFPALLKLYFKPGASPYILGGGELAIVLTKDSKPIDFGLVCGAGFRKKICSAYISLEVRYHHGLQDTNGGSWDLRKMRVFALIVGLSL